MTGASPFRLMLASLGLAVVSAAGIHALRPDGAEHTAVVATEPQPCSSCDARHARLQKLLEDPIKVQE